MSWLSEYEWTSPMQTSVSEWEKFLSKCYPCCCMDINALYDEFKTCAKTPSEKFITRPPEAK